MRAGQLLLTVMKPSGGAPINTAVPTHDGGSSAVIGTEISGTAGTWTGSPTLTYQWQRNTGSWGNIGGATSIDYTPVDADFGYTLRLAEIPNGDTGAAAYSAATATVILTGLSLWLDASDAATLFQDSAGTTAATANNDVIGRWADKSGNANHATQTTTADKPLLKTAVQNGLNAVQGISTDKLLLPDLSAMTAGQVFVVVSNASAATDMWRLGSHAERSFWVGAGPSIYDTFGTTARKNTGNPATTIPSFNVANFNIYSAASASGAWTNWINGTQHYTTGTNTVGFPSDPMLFHTSFSGFHGSFAELLLFTRVLTTDERDAVTEYLNTKWAVY